MKKHISGVLCLSLIFSSAAFSENTESLNSIREQTQDIYRGATGPDNATFNTIGKSMIAWGLGLSAAIAILSAAIKQSDSDTTTSSSSSE